MSDPSSDLEYRPHSVVDPRELGPLIERLLVVGAVDDETADLLTGCGADDVRNARVPSALRRLHDGWYLIDGGGATDAVVVYGALDETASAAGRLRNDRSHLAAAYDVLDDHWSQAADIIGAPPFKPGDIVRPHGIDGIGLVRSVRRNGNSHVVSVQIDASVRGFGVEDLELLTGDPRDPEFWMAQPPARARETALMLSWLKLAYPLTDFLYSFAATRTRFRAYQFLPALKVLSGSTGRLLIADEVGLGKTIEAGLIWAELEQRAQIRRALVVVPASLTVKWQREMRSRFMRPLPVFKRGDLEEFVSEIRSGDDPDLVGIISVEALRGSPDLLAELHDLRPRFDLVIVDEAHVLRNRGTRSYEVGDFFSDHADHLLFLSATPLNLGSEDLFNLVNLLDPEGFPNAEVFAAQLEPNRILNAIARNVSDPDQRAPHVARQELDRIPAMPHGRALARRPDFQRLRTLLSQPDTMDPERIASVKRLAGDLNTLSGVVNRTRKIDVQEKKALRVVEQVEVEWTHAEWQTYRTIEAFYLERARTKRMPLGFLLQMPLRQAASCLPVALERLREKSGWTTDDERAVAGELAVDGEDLSAMPLLAEAPAEDTKYDALVERLREARRHGLRQVLIFSFFRGTVEYLANRLAREFSTDFLHGGVPSGNRDAVIDRFREGRVDILVANQVGSEGLDFQFCNVLVNYDLPWNPMQVEQRIGRLDRIGQEHDKIFIYNMAIPGTIETDIINRLYTRIGIFEHSIGDLEPIMRRTIRDLESSVLDPTLTPIERERELDRLAQVAERERDDARRIEDASGILSTTLQVEVDGLTPDGPSSGRYMGAREIRALLEWVLSRHGGEVRERDARTQVIGNLRLVEAIRAKVAQPEIGTERGRDLLRDLRDGEPIDVAFRPPPLGTLGVELISARHPLIRLAVAELSQEQFALRRYGRVRIGQGSQRILASVDLIQTTGVAPVRELWATAVDAETGQRLPEVESELLSAAAEGSLRDVEFEPMEPRSLARLRQRLNGYVIERVAEARVIRGAENGALVDARAESQRNTLRLKLAAVERQLLEQRGGDRRILRMHEGRRRALQMSLDDIAAEFERKRRFSLSFEPMAVLEVVR